MKVKVQELRGIEAETVEKLNAQGILDSDQLLDKAGEAKARATLAAALGIDAKHLLKLINYADLARIKGVGRVYADLLEHAGVDSVMELRNRKPENLHSKLASVASEHGVKRVPLLNEVESWVEQAKQLERKVHH
jgi:predicted flap endonuclease-1-like 5' DNA nuclease